MSPQGQQQGYPGAPPFPGQYNSPSQPPLPSYHQLFGQSRAEQLHEKHIQNIDQPDVKVAAPKEFKVGIKVEAVDRRFPYFVCVATVVDKGEKSHEVLIHFDGWSNAYDYWCESDAIELHPVGWCETYGWELQNPRGIIFTYTHTYIAQFSSILVAMCIHQCCSYVYTHASLLSSNQDTTCCILRIT